MILPLSPSSTIFNNNPPHLTTNESPFSQFGDFDALTSFLTSQNCTIDQWSVWKKDIKKFVLDHSQNLGQVDQFFQKITKWGLSQNVQRTMEFILEISSVDLLEKIARIKVQSQSSSISFNNVFDWAKENASLCPPPIEKSMKGDIKKEWKKYRRTVLHFIPNVINIFLSAFNFLHANRRFTTLWEKHLILEIIYKFFIIPLALVAILRPFFAATAKVYLTAALIIAATGLLLACYQKWLRPLPDEIINCTNLDVKFEKGMIEPKVGQAEAMQELVAALEVDSNVLLIGHSGEGKTALMHQFVQLKGKGGQLSDCLQKLSAYEVDCGVMISSISIGHSELINQIKDQIEGYENQIILFFDEFYQIANNVSAFQAFKKRFLEDKPHPKFVATVTHKEFQMLKTLDIDGSFRRRITPILIESSTDQQTQIVVQDLIHRLASDIPVADDTIDTLLDVSQEKDYLPEIGRPAKAIKILMDAIGKCRASYNPHYASLELCQHAQDLFKLKQEAKIQGNASLDMLQKKKIIEGKIQDCEEILKKDKTRLKNIQRILQDQDKIKNDYYRLTHEFAKRSSLKNQSNLLHQSVDQKAQTLYLWSYFYALDSIKEILQEEIKQVKTTLSVQVDEMLIMSIYNQTKQIESCLANPKPYQNVKNDDLGFLGTVDFTSDTVREEI